MSVLVDPKTGLASVEDVIEHTAYRAAHRVTLKVPKFVDLGVRWLERGDGRSQSGYYANIDGRDMKLTTGAVKTASRLVKSTPDFFRQFGDRDAFPKTLRNIIDAPGSRFDGVLVRHNGLEVNCILHPGYQVMDAVNLLGDFVESCNKSIARVKGILPIEQENGDIVSYRVVMDNNVLNNFRNEEAQFIMFVLSMSETGMCNTNASLGLYRTSCTNSAIHGHTQNSWNHKSPIDGFFRSTEETIRQTGYMCDQYSRVFGGLIDLPLEHDPNLTLQAMKVTRSISKDHFDASKIWAMGRTESDQPISTHYDMFNVLTKSAQSLPGVEARERAERSAMDLFASKDGLYKELEKQAAKIRYKGELFPSFN